MIEYSPLEIHFNPENYENPEKFKPERFEEKNLRKKQGYLPFSIGPRVCVGQYLGEMLLKLITASFYKRFEAEEIKECSYKKTMDPFYCYEKPMVLVKERK